MTLSKRAIRAGGWTIAGHFAGQVLRFGSNLLMTRLLAPEMFGVMTLAFTFLFALQMFSDLGLTQVVTQSARGHERRFLNVIWTVQAIRGGLICAIGMSIAGGIRVGTAMGWIPPDTTYGHPDLPLALLLISLSALISGFDSVKLISKVRDLALSKVISIELVSQIVSLLVMVAWALMSPGVIALAVGAIASAVIHVALSHFWIQGEHDSLAWDGSIFGEIFKFGRWVFLSSILGFLTLSLDKIILGGQLTATEFGIYSIATLLFMALNDVGQRLVSAVLFPALSEVNRTNPDSLRASFYRIRIPIDLYAAGVGLLLLIFGAEIVGRLYDARYHTAGHVLEIMSIALFILGTNASSQVYLVVGKPWMMTMLIGLRLVGLAVGLPLLTAQYGLVGTAWAIVIAQALPLPVMYFFMIRMKIFDWRRELVTVGLMSFGIAYAMGALGRLDVSGVFGPFSRTAGL